MSHDIPKYMGTDYVEAKTEIDTCWKQLRTLQEMAHDYGIDNIFQDNGAEILQQLVYLNMKGVPGRNGNDGEDSNGCQWEMKSIDISKGNKGITTNHHLTMGIIEKYETVPWSIAVYDKIELKKIYVIGADKLSPIFKEWKNKIKKTLKIMEKKI